MAAVFASDMLYNRGSSDAFRNLPSISALFLLGFQIRQIGCVVTRGPPGAPRMHYINRERKSSCYEDMAEVSRKWPSFGLMPIPEPRPGARPGLGHVISSETEGLGLPNPNNVA